MPKTAAKIVAKAAGKPAAEAVAFPDCFEGFADADARFFRALAKNQRREWFQAHKHEYEHGLARADEARSSPRCASASTRSSRSTPLGEPKVFRIYRDVRFSKDKSPYKTHIGGYVAARRQRARAVGDRRRSTSTSARASRSSPPATT